MALENMVFRWHILPNICKQPWVEKTTEQMTRTALQHHFLLKRTFCRESVTTSINSSPSSWSLHSPCKSLSTIGHMNMRESLGKYSWDIFLISHFRLENNYVRNHLLNILPTIYLNIVKVIFKLMMMNRIKKESIFWRICQSKSRYRRKTSQ